MSLSKIVQESVEKFDEQFKSSYAYPFVFDETCNEDVKNFIISSQISLLEAEIERKKGMMKEMHHHISCKETHLEAFCECVDEVSMYYNQAIQEDILYLTEQIEECRKLLK